MTFGGLVIVITITFFAGWWIGRININTNHIIKQRTSGHCCTDNDIVNEDATFNTIDAILLQAIAYSKACGRFPELNLIEIPMTGTVKQGIIADQYGHKIRYSVTKNRLEVRSAGSDGIFGTDDDVVGTMSLEQFGRRIIGKYGTFFSGSEL